MALIKGQPALTEPPPHPTLSFFSCLSPLMKRNRSTGHFTEVMADSVWLSIRRWLYVEASCCDGSV